MEIVKIIDKINKVTTTKKLIDEFYPKILKKVSELSQVSETPENLLNPEHPLFIETLRKIGYTEDQIVTVLIDYYSGEPIKDILTNTAYTVLGATITFLIGYSALTIGPVIAMISTEKQLFDAYNTILDFVTTEEKNI